MNERAYKEVNIRIELTGNTMGFATIELKPVGGEPIAERAAKPVGDSVSVVDASVPANAREEYDKAQSALVDNKTEAAIGHLQKAVKLYKPFPSAYTLLGRAYLTQKNWTEAEGALHKAISLDADSAEAYLALGAVYNQTKNYSGAEAALAMLESFCIIRGGEAAWTKEFKEIVKAILAEPFAFSVRSQRP